VIATANYNGLLNALAFAVPISQSSDGEWADLLEREYLNRVPDSASSEIGYSW
jgi:hypothetical protein